MKLLLALFLCGLVFSSPTMAYPTDKQREVCKKVAGDFADIILRTKGKGRFSYNDATTSHVGEQVWNSMLLEYERNPKLTYRELSILGNSSCLSRM